MDGRRGLQTVPKVRQVGFFAPSTAAAPTPTQSAPISAPLTQSPTNDSSLSPVMIPPPRHLSDNLSHRPTSPLPVPEPRALRRLPPADHLPVAGSYNPTDSLFGISPSSRLGDGEFSDESSPVWSRRTNSTKFAYSFPNGGFDLTSLNSAENSKFDEEKHVVVSGKSVGDVAAQVHNEVPSNAKTLKGTSTKADRRALQESQRAAKAAGKAMGNKSSGVPEVAPSVKSMKTQPSKSKNTPSIARSVSASDKKVGERQLDKEKRNDVPPPRMQFDDKKRVEKAKRRALVNKTEARNRVELFQHVPQYEYGTQLPHLESKLFQLDSMHPAVYKVGVKFLAGDISGDNARCVAMLRAFQEVIKDYTFPPGKDIRDLLTKVNNYVSFFNECRPLSTSMGNAIRFVKSLLSKMPHTISESEAKASLYSDIDRFINEKIVLANKVVVQYAATKIRDGDVLLTYGSSYIVEMIFLYALELKKHFRVIVVDSRPIFEGQALVRRLVAKGLRCSYTHVNAVSYIMREVTHVFLGASSVLANGTVYSRVGTACVAMVAHAFRVPVLICCEAYKFHERVQLDSICSNELGDPDAILKVPGRTDVNHLDKLTHNECLQLLNLMYDITPSEYISMIITDFGMIPPSSVPVIAREYGEEQLWLLKS
ncbi:hypothetical protein K2173_003991 [Erythroxylum novogranatense]|uniref:Translation initiation factor eIF2B subunit delta n=1 Tax=Erythroxylum novogranatense TaxID=1862640 RepID=A0AAV8SKC6_9ROSI|nr:hypothetical protein K2173_003991 [Erythroxylum novogranatense]